MWTKFKNPEVTFKGIVNMDSPVVRCLSKVGRISLHTISSNIVLFMASISQMDTIQKYKTITDPIKPNETNGNSDQLILDCLKPKA